MLPNEAETTCSRNRTYVRTSRLPDHIRRMWTCQIESESNLSRATDKAEEGSKNGLRSKLRASNLTKISLGGRPPLAACLHTQSRTRPDKFNFASAGPAWESLVSLINRGTCHTMCVVCTCRIVCTFVLLNEKGRNHNFEGETTTRASISASQLESRNT